ncbi:nitroreductase/quinone reductase family protein [Nocardia ignorata]|uniref:nitroreductase/quinone reductase family protein n=1 Tax=Nocardia ignorata TaxID=145285 RepID=UPI003640DEFE
MTVWKLTGPAVRLLTPINPWWVVIETTGRKSGLRRRRPLVRGPKQGNTMSVLGLHGRRTDWIRNIEADPNVRLRTMLRWHEATATVTDLTKADLARFNSYARAAVATFQIEDDPPVLVHIQLLDRAPTALRALVKAQAKREA